MIKGWVYALFSHCPERALQNQPFESFLFPLHSLMLQPGLKRVHGSLAIQDITRYTEGRNSPLSLGSLPSLPFATHRELIERAALLYQEASLAQKGLLLDPVVALTGYARTYVIRLLHQAPQGKRTILRPRLPRYGSEVQHALVLAWQATKHLCAKRLIPFLPTCIAALERYGHLHLSEESRRQVLQVSISTAERLLRSQHPPTPRALSMTQAGPLLKQHIPFALSLSGIMPSQAL